MVESDTADVERTGRQGNTTVEHASDSVEQYLERCRAAAQLVTPGQSVRAVGILGRRGKRVGRRSPNNVMVAVTPTRLLSFEYAGRPDRIKVLRMVGDWPRSVVDVEVEPAADAKVVRFKLIDGRNVELEDVAQPGLADRVNVPFYEALGLPAIA